MKRREFLALVAVMSVWPLRSRAQQPSIPVIGMLGSSSPDAWTKRLQGFRNGLAKNGYVEGQNVRIEYRWAENRNDRLPTLAADLVRQPVDVIVVLGNTSSALAAKAATSTVPIVARISSDPVALGLVSSLNQPGGNITGVTTLGATTVPKQLELLHELAPGVKTLALLINPTNPEVANAEMQAALAAARGLGFEVHILRASTDHELEEAFATLNRIGAGALLIGVDAFFNARNEQLGDLTLKSRVPTVAPYKEFAEAGGLLSYGSSVERASEQIGVYTGRILKGEKPGNLPFLQPTEISLVINMKTARQLGLSIPSPILARADDVIE